MLALVKMPHTKTPLFEVKGDVPNKIIKYLKQDYDVEVTTDEDEEYVNITETDWYNGIEVAPGEAMRIYRNNFSFSQAELGKRLGGLSRHNISDMENNRRGISKDIAKKLCVVFDVSIDRFI